MTEISIFDTYRSKDFDVFFQQEAELDSKVDVRYVKYGREDIQSYVNDVAKPDIADYTSEKKSSINDYVADKLDTISTHADVKQQEMVDGISSQVSGIVDTLNQQLESINYEVTAIAAQVDSIVTTYDDEEITGSKIFDAYTYSSNLPDVPEPARQAFYNPYFNKESIIPARASAGSSTYKLYCDIDFIKDGTTEGEYFRYGRIGGYQKVTATRMNGQSSTTVTFAEPVMRMALYKDENTASAVEVGFDGSNNPVVSIPTPPSSASGTQAVTAAWANDKYATKSLSNLDATGKATAAKMILPSSSTQTLTIGGSGASYTAPSTGWVLLDFKGVTGISGPVYAQIEGGGILARCDQYRATSATTMRVACCLAVERGTSFVITYLLGTGATYTSATLTFVKANGEV